MPLFIVTEIDDPNEPSIRLFEAPNMRTVENHIQRLHENNLDAEFHNMEWDDFVDHLLEAGDVVLIVNEAPKIETLP